MILYIFIILGLIGFILTEINRQQRPVYKFVSYYKNFPIIIMGLLNSIYKSIDNNCIFEYKNLTIHKKLCANHDKLLDEFNRNYSKYKLINPGVFSNEFHETNNKYGYFNIKYYGNVNEDKFPLLTKLVDNNDIYTCFYSVIKGKKNIPEHRGPYAGILRYHYTLFSSNDIKDYLKVLVKCYESLKKNGKLTITIAALGILFHLPFYRLVRLDALYIFIPIYLVSIVGEKRLFVFLPYLVLQLLYAGFVLRKASQAGLLKK